MMDLILHDVKWRMRFISTVRGCVYVFLISLVLLVLRTEWERNRVYTTGSYNEYISVYGEAKRDDIKALKKELSKIPDWLIEEYIANGGVVYLTSRPIENMQENYGEENDDSYKLIGLHTVRNGVVKIWIYNSPQAIKGATLHEFGHYLDRYYGFISQSDVFFFIYEHENDIFLEIGGGEYHTSTLLEYFAECFEWYINNPRSLKRNCPQTYKFLGSIIYPP